MKDLVALSRRASHALRHEPWLYALELDDGGWVAVAELAAALKASPADVVAMAATSSKNRYELEGDRIRARYGHSLPERIELQRATPPPRLFHGTAPESLPSILREGLTARARQYVHLSVDAGTAREVGRRKARRPVVLAIDSATMAAEGLPFYRGNETIWLADAVPPRFIVAKG